MWTPEYYVRFNEMPLTVHGVVLPNDDGTFNIYINSLLSEEQQEECLQHEICHIREDHFYEDTSVTECEDRADNRRAG